VRRLRSLSFVLAVIAPGCGGGDGRTPLVRYSPHGPDQLGALEQAFEARNPDVDVRWLDVGSQDVFDRGVTDSLLSPYRPARSARGPERPRA
jgi:iron(III) transport system substrate-binding protein